MRKRKNLDITEDDLLREVDSMRKEIDPRRRTFTEEQDKALAYARSGDRKVGWDDIQSFWLAKGWGNIAKDTLRRRLRELEGGAA